MKEWVNRVYSAADAGTPLQLMKKGSSVFDVPSSPADSMVHACTARRLKPEPQKKAISMLQPSPRSRVHLLQPSPRRDRRTASSRRDVDTAPASSSATRRANVSA